MPDRRAVRLAVIFLLLGGSLLVNILFVMAIRSGTDLRGEFVRLRNTLFSREDEAAKLGPGWHRLGPNTPGGAADDSLAEAMRKLESLAYLSGSRSAPGGTSVVHHDADHAYQGYSLYCSAHAPEAVLMDMDGHEVHRWQRAADEAWLDFEPEKDTWGHTCWRRVHLYPNGDLLALFTGVGLIKIDRNSSVQWAYRGRTHHDLCVAPDGSIFVLTRKAKVDPYYDARNPILEDFVTQLDPEGKEILKVSVLEAFENSAYAPVSMQIKKKMERLDGYGDILHTNTIEVLDGRLAERLPAFRPGNLLLSPLFPEHVSVLDLESRTIVWSLGGLWHRQHEPSLLNNGNILVFDNNGNRGESRIIEFDPVTQETVWLYSGSEGRPFVSNTCGACQRLPNGNTLITESEAGRAFEVTPDGFIVWEFVSPHRAGQNNDLIATLFALTRIETAYASGWLIRN